jgi:hypothetical protein
MELEAIVALTIVFEILTVALRLIFRLRSKEIQGDFGIPRVHHGYIGMVLLLVSYVMPGLSSAFWVTGWALIISDLVHHYTVLPLLRITETDISMKYYGIKKDSVRRKVLIAVAGGIVVAVLSSVATSLWVGVIAMGMIFVSEKLEELLAKLKLSKEVARHF